MTLRRRQFLHLAAGAAALPAASKMASKNSTLSAINRGGIATLADGTCWHISSSELLKAKNWRIGAAVVIQGHHLTNVETGVQIDVVPIPLSSER
jgi:hypothetical protein